MYRGHRGGGRDNGGGGLSDRSIGRQGLVRRAALCARPELDIPTYPAEAAAAEPLPPSSRQARAAGASNDHRHRQRHDRHPAHRKDLERYGDRFISRSSPRSSSASQTGGPARGVLCQAVRRQGGLFEGARHGLPRQRVSGAIWGSSTNPRASPRCISPAAP